MCIFLENLKVKTSYDLAFLLLYISNKTVLHSWAAIGSMQQFKFKIKKKILKFDYVKKFVTQTTSGML